MVAIDTHAAVKELIDSVSAELKSDIAAVRSDLETAMVETKVAILKWVMIGAIGCKRWRSLAQ